MNNLVDKNNMLSTVRQLRYLSFTASTQAGISTFVALYSHEAYCSMTKGAESLNVSSLTPTRQFLTSNKNRKVKTIYNRCLNNV